MRTCRFPRCHEPATLVQLPLLGRWTWVCQRHWYVAFIAAMREMVPHG